MLLVAPLAPADLDAALALVLQPRVREPLFAGPPLTPDTLRQRTYFVARLAPQGPVVGLLGLHAEGLSYAIDPALWGRGLGGELLATACHTLAPAAGLRRLQALVQRDNLRSRRLLERTGFRFCGLRPMPRGPVLRYEHPLPNPARPAAAGPPQPHPEP